jgi:16S rRNA processing protein RimM
LKVLSYTDAPLGILQHRVWQVGNGESWLLYEMISGRAHGAGVVAQLAGIDDRDQARALAGMFVAVQRDQLGTAAKNEFFWADLEGLQVVTKDGVMLGQVSHLFATGANDVMVVQPPDVGRVQRLIPFTRQVVQNVDLDEGLIIVDWDLGNLD